MEGAKIWRQFGMMRTAVMNKVGLECSRHRPDRPLDAFEGPREPRLMPA